MNSASRNQQQPLLKRTFRRLVAKLRHSARDGNHRVLNVVLRIFFGKPTLARKSGLSEEDSQDVVQDTVISVARRMPEFCYEPAKGSFKQWLLLITRRRIHDRLRRLYRSVR